ncbi:MAG: hypothetical protein ABIZ05_01840 [Pseudonocardiaceae bacterium]
MTDLPMTRWNGKFRRVIHATCVPRRSSVRFTNLVVSARGGVIKLDPRAPGVGAITIDENEARVLRDTLIKWLG